MGKSTLFKGNFAYISILLLGIFLATFQFFINRSLWVDEAMLAMGIINKTPHELLDKPLAYQQVAPILFVQIEGLFSSLLPDSEYGLRLFPLLCFIGSLPLMYNFSLLTTGNKATACLSLLIFSLTPFLIYYSSEVKQYISDVFTCLLLVYLTFRHYKRERNQLLALALAGTLSIFLSNVSVVILATIGLSLIYRYRDNLKKARLLLIPFSFWAIAFLYYYFSFIKNHPSREYMLIYWAATFMPLNPMHKQFWLWQKDAVHTIFDYLLGYWYFSKLAIIFYLLGLTMLIKNKEYGLFIILTFSIAIHLILSGLQLYPFAERLILYLTPFFILAICIGYETLCSFLNKKLQSKILYIASFAVLPAIVASQLFKVYSFKISEIKDSFSFLSKARNPNEKIYVPFLTVPQYQYYTTTGKSKLNTNVIYGEWNKGRGTAKGQLSELTQLDSKGWVLFTLHNPQEQDSIFYFLKSRGTLEKKFETTGSSVYQYLPRPLIKK